MSEAKPYDISKRLVWDAWEQVKENHGAAGVDGVSIAAFEKDLKRNLFKVWNRMSSGSYFAPPVRLVEIPKANGGIRPLGIPTIADRVAQTVVKMVLEPEVEPIFHAASYGYRPGRSALDAVGTARERCWKFDWVIDLDIKSFFDTIPHDLIEKAVARHTELGWVRLYVKRWLRAPVERADGNAWSERKEPRKVPSSARCWQLFLHYAFDLWMQRTFPHLCFERYADDAIVHCRSESQARSVVEAIRQRLAECGLELHSEKTRIVYCKDATRRQCHENVAFDFLGYTFQPRRARNRQGKNFVSFLPAISAKAAKGIRQSPRMADSLDPEQPTARRFGKADRSRGAGMDELLRALLPYEVHRGPAPHQRGSRPMGETEIPPVAISKTRVHTLAGTARAARPEPLVSVADWYPTVGWKVEAG